MERRRRAVMSRRAVGAAGGLAVVGSLLTGSPAQAASFTVTSTADSGTGSLRSAIMAADTAGGSNTILFLSGISGSIDLASPLPGITSPLAITGPGSGALTVNAEGTGRIFYIGSGLSAGSEISGLTLTGGSLPTAFGGAIDTRSALALVGDTIFGNTAKQAGGINGYGPLTIENSTISGNTSTDYGGGGIFMGNGYQLRISDSTVAGNQATGTAYGYGGGIADFGGSAAITGSTISGNTAARQGTAVAGGGIYATGTALTVADSTIAGNTAASDQGGGIGEGSGALTVTGSTISGNHAPGATSGYGGGLYLGKTVTAAALQDTIVFGNTAGKGGPDVFTSTGTGHPTPTAAFSLLGSVSGSGITPDATDIVGADPELGPLQANGGPTATMAPAFTSPVIDKGKAFGLTTDQRGAPRPVDLPGYPNAAGGDGSDIGAVELQPAEVAPGVSGVSPATGPAGTSVVISGSRLATATQVLFGSTPATFTVNANGQVVAKAPAGSGTIDVRVLTPGGESAAVAADHYAYAHVTTVRFQGQLITLTTPSLQACTASTSKLPVKLTSTRLSRGKKLRFSSAGFFVGKGVRHTHKKTVHLKNGKTKKIKVVTYTANAVVRHVPANVSLKLKGLKSGSHTLKLVISYKETVTKHHHKTTITVTKTLRVKFNVC
jgi:hypothetical protein